jgi:hypothetical protein
MIPSGVTPKEASSTHKAEILIKIKDSPRTTLPTEQLVDDVARPPEKPEIQRRTAFDLRSMVAVLCCELLILPVAGCASRPQEIPAVPLVQDVFQPLRDDLKKSYTTLFKIAPTLEYSNTQLTKMSEYMNQAKDYCVARFQETSDRYGKEVENAQKALKGANVTGAERHNLHCTIQNSRALKSQADVIANHAIPVAYDNKQAKLDLIREWPAQLKEIQQSIRDGSYLHRHWGDVKDIGFRRIEPGQKDDIKAGQDAIKQMKLSGLMPKEIENKEVVDYVTKVANKIAANSDLLVPLHVTVLNLKEINAFALPGGFVFVERGLLEAAGDESELAGVLGHEISHVVARHSHKLMTKATIASIVYQAAQVAAVVLTGGVAGIGTYYALQYGFYGLGLALDLRLLGVSRDFELQADQLGMQYAWKAGYDPTGFVRFFDKMATQEGYVNGVSWFRSHPPFYQRMVDSEREYMYLPKLKNPIVNTSDFKAMKDALKSVTAKAKEDEKTKPSLIAPEQGCAAPGKLVYEPDQPIEAICAEPGTKPVSPRHTS